METPLWLHRLTHTHTHTHLNTYKPANTRTQPHTKHTPEHAQRTQPWCWQWRHLCGCPPTSCWAAEPGAQNNSFIMNHKFCTKLFQISQNIKEAMFKNRKYKRAINFRKWSQLAFSFTMHTEKEKQEKQKHPKNLWSPWDPHPQPIPKKKQVIPTTSIYILPPELCYWGFNQTKTSLLPALLLRDLTNNKSHNHPVFITGEVKNKIPPPPTPPPTSLLEDLPKNPCLPPSTPHKENTHTRMHTHTHRHTFAHTHRCTHTHPYRHMYTRMPVHTHTHIHTKPPLSWQGKKDSAPLTSGWYKE